MRYSLIHLIFLNFLNVFNFLNALNFTRINDNANENQFKQCKLIENIKYFNFNYENFKNNLIIIVD